MHFKIEISYVNAVLIHENDKKKFRFDWAGGQLSIVVSMFKSNVMKLVSISLVFDNLLLKFVLGLSYTFTHVPDCIGGNCQTLPDMKAVDSPCHLSLQITENP